MKPFQFLFFWMLTLSANAYVLTPAEVNDKIVNVAPIVGISFGDLSDKTTWNINFTSSATDEQKQAAQIIVDGITTLPLVEGHKSITTVQFFDRLTDFEIANLENSTDAIIVKWRKKLGYCTIMEYDTEEAEGLQAYLVSLGLFTPERLAEIFK